jgi:hypothetical protein
LAVFLEEEMIWKSGQWMAMEVWLSILFLWIGTIWQTVRRMLWTSEEVMLGQEV